MMSWLFVSLTWDEGAQCSASVQNKSSNTTCMWTQIVGQYTTKDLSSFVVKLGIPQEVPLAPTRHTLWHDTAMRPRKSQILHTRVARMVQQALLARDSKA